MSLASESHCWMGFKTKPLACSFHFRFTKRLEFRRGQRENYDKTQCNHAMNSGSETMQPYRKSKASGLGIAPGARSATMSTSDRDTRSIANATAGVNRSAARRACNCRWTSGARLESRCASEMEAMKRAQEIEAGETVLLCECANFFEI